MDYGVNLLRASARSPQVHSRKRANIWHMDYFNLRTGGPKCNCAHYMRVLIVAMPGETD